jgi:hypothetical protein
VRKNGECGRNDGRKSFPEVFVGDFEVLFQASVISEIERTEKPTSAAFAKSSSALANAALSRSDRFNFFDKLLTLSI